MIPSKSTLLLVAPFAASVSALNNGAYRTPPMGYNTYNDVACSPTADQIGSTIDALKSKGFLSLGYNIVQLDCGWQAVDRQSNGSITYDTSVFPNGIKPLSDRAHAAGFKWGMYTDLGVYSCDTKVFNRAGSKGYETQDAAMFEAWSADIVKLDNCYVDADQNAPKDPRSDFVSRYSAMSNALQNVNIKGITTCQWGVPQISDSGLQGPADWAPPLATSYRISDDIAQGWNNVMRITNQAIYVNLRGTNGPGQFIDMDLLEVGNPGMSLAEQRTHFATWNAFKSAVMISTNVPNMNADTKNILSNKDIIAINQDGLGKPVTLAQRYTDDHDVYSGPLANGDTVVYAFDTSNKARTLNIDLAALGISSATVKDLWSGKTSSNVKTFSKSIDAHDNVILRLSNVVKSNAAAPKRTYYSAAAGSLSGGANVQSCSGCSSGNKVGYIGSGAGVTISNIRTSQTTQDVLFDYLNCENSYLGGSTVNERRASVSVNGGAPVTVAFPLTGYNWDRELIKGYRVRLAGFKTGAANTVQVTGVNGGSYGPDLDRIAVVA